MVCQVSTLQCYMGTDSQCFLMDTSYSQNGCGDGIPVKNCVCAKYRVQCTPDDTACTTEEQRLKTVKWAYIMTTDQMCKQMKKMPEMFRQQKCCKKNKCNAPQSKSVKCMNMFPMDSGTGKQKKAPPASRRQNVM
ncbi:unnamed protein product [Rotaria magnacalcarata]|nr:unnamed protein product [Rotaria magnacalcarata]